MLKHLFPSRSALMTNRSSLRPLSFYFVLTLSHLGHRFLFFYMKHNGLCLGKQYKNDLAGQSKGEWGHCAHCTGWNRGAGLTWIINKFLRNFLNIRELLPFGSFKDREMGQKAKRSAWPCLEPRQKGATTTFLTGYRSGTRRCSRPLYHPSHGLTVVMNR